MYNREILFNNRSNFLWNDKYTLNKASQLSNILGNHTLFIGWDREQVIEIVDISNYNNDLISEQIKEIFDDSIFLFCMISLLKDVLKNRAILSRKR